jgi:LysM repeat protein
VNRRPHRFRLATPAALLLGGALWLGACPVAAEANDHGPATHTIYKGQTLGMIAKRYRVSVPALCNANGIQQNHKIKPGDKLVIPARADKDGSEAAAKRNAMLGSGKKGKPTPAPKQPASSKGNPPTNPKQISKDATGSHKVYRGQTLGMIAKRYRISVAALCNANGITPSSTIRPGDELLIPSRADEDGSVARKQLAARGGSSVAPSTPNSSSRSKPKVHLVTKGDTFSEIAKKYGTSVAALTYANRMTPSTRLHLGRELVVPTSADTDGKRAREWWSKEQSAVQKGKSASRSWRKYKKMAWRRGYITLQSPNGKKRWKGYVIGPGNKLLPLARQKVTDVLASWRTGKTKTIHRRLVALIAKVSDTFGGRTIRVVSGYREHSHSARSRHPEGQALDFSVQGVPNWAVRDYLRGLPNVGVGYYPNSSFVHLDVRDEATYWVDVSKPGQAPRYVHRSKGVKR